jgi:hypothetical protein
MQAPEGSCQQFIRVENNVSIVDIGIIWFICRI